MSIRKRLFLAFLIVIGLGFYFLVDWIIDDLRPRYLEAMEETMIDTATVLSSMVEGSIVDDEMDVQDLRDAFEAAKNKEFSAKIYNVLKTNLNMRVYVVDRKGFVILDSDVDGDEGRNYSQWNDVVRTMKGQYGARATRVDPDDPKSTILYVASPVRINGEIAGVLTVCKPTDSVTLFFNTARTQIVWAGLATALVVAFIGMLISSWITHPIQKLTRYARDVRDGRRTSAPALGSSEIGELGSAFEEMRDALEGRQYVENYVQTLTHEMKSPLSAIYGAAELLNEDMPREQSRQFIYNIREETARIQDLVDRLLQLSSLEKRKGLRDVESIDVGALISDVIESVKPILSNKKIAIEFDEQDPIALEGERFLLRQAIANLLQNAIDFSPMEGKISVCLKKADKHAEIIILDKGPGIPGYALDKIFDRFYSLRRPDTGKKSSGLGLTFVREVAALHGGKIELYNYPEGGAGATMTLPV